ncbi:MAG TPA: TonB family protein [Verrucomicrobiae bacterium]|nr:TonB family protein [Verrucomicrobiae bacterium]
MKAILAKVALAIGVIGVISLTCNSSQEDTPISDKDVHYTSYEEMPYPAFARQTRTEGVVVVRLKLDDHGRVTLAIAVSGHEHLIQGAVENAKKWQFEPNSRKAAVLVYNFRMASGLCNSTFFNFQPPDFITVIGCPGPIEEEKTSRPSSTN